MSGREAARRDADSVQVIATTISGSISDWKKVERIVPLFEKQGRTDVVVHTANSHARALELTRDLAAAGSRTIISAGGSGTFASVLEGCIASGVGLSEITLGFLRKGSADLLGKALDMPDEIESAIRVFGEALREGRTLPCDVIRASSESTGAARHLVGYGGAEVFGRIPHYTENRFIKYYKGVLSQLFGDLGPFTVGASMAATEKVLRRIAGGGRRRWRITVDGTEAARGRYQAMVIVNGDLGPDLPFARGAPLGSGRFHLFTFRDLGLFRIFGQMRAGFTGKAMEDPSRWGFESHEIADSLVIAPEDGAPFPVNADGSTLPSRGEATFRIVDRINLISGK